MSIEPLQEYLGKLRTLADGALASIDRQRHDPARGDSDRQKSWWQGYRQCLDDVQDHHEKERNP